MVRKITQLDLSAVQERIKERLEDTGKTARGASIEAGLGASTIRNILEGRATSPRVDTLASIAKVLGMSPHWFLGTSDRDAETDMDTRLLKKDLSKKGLQTARGEARFPNTIPLFAPALSDNSKMVLSPTFMAISREAFSLPDTSNLIAVQIRDSSLEPAYYLEDIIIVSSDLSLTVNNDYLFKKSMDDKEGWQRSTLHIIARLLSFDEEHFLVKSFTSKKDVRLDRKEYTEAAAIIGKAYRRL